MSGAAQNEPPYRTYLTAEEEDQLVGRLYTQSLSHREATMAELQSRYYPVAATQTLTEEQVQRSVKRQVDDEMEQRRQRQALLEQTASKGEYRGGATQASSMSDKKMAREDVDASVRRLYDETLAKKKANMLESEKRYLFDRTSVKSRRMSKAEFKESVDRMSKPKKTEFTIAEVNKIYGL